MNIKTNQLKYKIKSASEYDILFHLTECGDSFIPPLAGRVNINDYAKKIFERSVTFEGWSEELLVGFIATYFYDNADRSAFITNVSVLKSFSSLGIASKLLDMCIEYARKTNFEILALEVHEQNNPAIYLYKKSGFYTYETKGNLLLMKRQI